MDSELEKRVEALEREIDRIKSTIGKIECDRRPWWESQAGVFKDDPLFDEIVEAGQQYRKSQVDPIQ
jgi:hypothetical protein